MVSLAKFVTKERDFNDLRLEEELIFYQCRDRELFKETNINYYADDTTRKVL